MNKRWSYFKSGFTLIELLVVVAIIATLASVVAWSIDSARTKARDAQRVSEIKELQRALETYYSFGNDYPTCNSGDGWCDSDDGDFQTALQPLVTNDLISEIVSDPENRDGFIYRYYTQAGLSSTTCDGTDVDQFEYVILLATEERTLPWPESSANVTSGNEYCLVAQKTN